MSDVSLVKEPRNHRNVYEEVDGDVRFFLQYDVRIVGMKLQRGGFLAWGWPIEDGETSER